MAAGTELVVFAKRRRSTSAYDRHWFWSRNRNL